MAKFFALSLLLIFSTTSFALTLEERVAALEAERSSEHAESHRQDERFKFSGFGSFTASQISEDARGPNGQSDQVSIDPYTIFGMQFGVDITAQTRTVAQLVAEANEDFDPEFEWLFVEQQLGNFARLQVGRFGYAAFSESANAKIAYTYPAVSLLDEIYIRTIVESADGASLAFDFSNAGWHKSVTLYAGERSVERDLEMIDVKVDRLYGAYFEGSNDNWYVRVAYHAIRDSLLVLKAANDFALMMDNDQFGLAIKYQDLEWSLAYEVSFVESSSDDVGDILGQGITIARSLDKFQPYLQWGQYATDLGRDEPILDLNGQNAERQQQSIALGLRHDIASYVSMKYQTKYIYDLNGSKGLFNFYNNDPVDFSHAWAFDISIQFVFDESF